MEAVKRISQVLSTWIKRPSGVRMAIWVHFAKQSSLHLTLPTPNTTAYFTLPFLRLELMKKGEMEESNQD